jgi:hypothetical protein
VITLTVQETELNFEHSLVSLSNWEAEYEKPFFTPNKEEETKTSEQLLKYFEFMLVGESKKNRHLIQLLTHDQQLRLTHYMQKSRTATTVREIQTVRGPRENPTSELIYYWMVAFKIPFQPTEEWHLNRLLMLIRVCGIKQAPPPKGLKNRAKLAQSMREINEQRRQKYGTSG